ncbi:MAG TPA: hypothetical protein DDZ80_23765 [Cyanobacteria bacterium UBA8803]|nr:hypothetical protein [Cyanobacteria bacterium UBA9273]HBL61336.1 hypothetical protein [Cyanobacteria bacterium UBA8803]
MIHHFLHKRLVIPIPDLWLIGVAVVLGKPLTMMGVKRQHRAKLSIALAGTTFVYGGVSLQLYNSVAILFPWVLPTAMLLAYALPLIIESREKST